MPVRRFDEGALVGEVAEDVVELLAVGRVPRVDAGDELLAAGSFRLLIVGGSSLEKVLFMAMSKHATSGLAFILADLQVERSGESPRLVGRSVQVARQDHLLESLLQPHDPEREPELLVEDLLLAGLAVVGDDGERVVEVPDAGLEKDGVRRPERGDERLQVGHARAGKNHDPLAVEVRRLCHPDSLKGVEDRVAEPGLRDDDHVCLRVVHKLEKAGLLLPGLERASVECEYL